MSQSLKEALTFMINLSGYVDSRITSKVFIRVFTFEIVMSCIPMCQGSCRLN
jgi:hypothetical protein